ncbi:hypothetical protein IHV25_08950 [Phaeovibrio sulfidiphilus]|uniref:Motility protein n=1 Tax=Phaeovibrio sulfidiphilus TaxID=1220600 RepID=A0A8J7CDI3_9PROT|nr:hypothetical protein [Phaeovibrio sulfidiphilus]MBE1237773.1 hypothetical protein [Phaeovibrio sulfidiphilus]
MDPVTIAQMAVTTQSAMTQTNLGVAAIKTAMDADKQVVALLDSVLVPGSPDLGKMLDVTV